MHVETYGSDDLNLETKEQPEFSPTQLPTTIQCTLVSPTIQGRKEGRKYIHACMLGGGGILNSLIFCPLLYEDLPPYQAQV